MRKQMIKTFFVLLLILIETPSWAALPYIEPYPGFIISTFGPRLNASSFHGGLDFVKPYGTPIPAIMDGRISEISSDLSGAGIRLYLTNDSDKKEIGYYHLFSYNNSYFNNGFVKSERFILVKEYTFSAFFPGLRVYKIEKTCSVILNTVAKIAYVPEPCWGVAVLSGSKKVVYNNITYTAKNTVKQNDLIAPVGDSLHNIEIIRGVKTEKFIVGPHLHIQDGRGVQAKHPMYSLKPTPSDNQLFFARLDLQGTDTSNTNVNELLPVNPTVSQATLNANKFIDVRVDSTNSLDLDAFVFTIYATNHTKPNLSGNVQYSSPNRSINSTPKTIEKFKQSIFLQISTAGNASFYCPTKLYPGEVAICPEVDWKPIVKGVKTGQRLVTRFRLGVDPDMFAPGKNTLNVTLKHAQSPDQPQFIPFDFTVTQVSSAPPLDVVGVWHAKYYGGDLLPLTTSDQFGTYSILSYSVTLTSSGNICETRTGTYLGVAYTDGSCTSDPHTYSYDYMYNPLTPDHQDVYLYYTGDAGKTQTPYHLRLSWTGDHWVMNWTYSNWEMTK